MALILIVIPGKGTHNQNGVVLNNRLRQAEATIRQKKVNPDKVLTLLKPLAKKKNAPWKVYHISGIASFLKKQFGKAEEFFIRALEAGSPNAETFCYAGRCCHVRNDHEKAAGYLKRAVEINRDYYAAWMYLGDVYKDTGKLNEALQCYGQCNRIDSSKAEVAMKIGGIYRDQAFSDKALEMFDIVLKMEPENISALNEKAKIYKDKQDHETALGVIRSALQIAPQEASLLATKAEILKESGDFLEALHIYEEMLERHPNYGGARVNYANILQDLGRFDEAEKNYLRANQDTPSFQETFSNYLFVQHYNPEKSKEEMLDALKKWDAIYAPESPVRPDPEDRDKEKKLRIGLVSGGFRKHPVGWMIVAGLENLDQEKYDLYFYSNHNQVDDVTKRLHKTAAEWRMISGFSDQKVNEMIREDEIDILVELSGHAAESRLRAVAMEPAPVIVKWVGGLINTTGLKAIDYLITDWIETPEGSDSDYLEKLVRMPDDYICFTPPPDSPEVKESPFRENGFITFGCFNNPIKVNPVLLEKWAGLMKQVPDSRLFLKSKQYGNEFYTRRIEALMQDFGIGKERLIFEGYSPHQELLEAYNRVDIALDPWPYSGGLTTCEALWMGVPVVTCPGPTFAGRHAATHVHNAGFPEWVAESWEEYVKKVSDLASDREKLAELRVGLRDNVAASPLCDGARFGAALGSAFRSMWVAYAEGCLKEDAIAVMIPEGDLTVGSLEEKEESVVEITGEEVPAESEAPSERAEAESVEIAQVEEQSEVPEKQQATSEGIDSTKESHEEYGDEPAVMASEKSLQSPAVGESTAAQSDESSSTANSDEEIEKIGRYPWKRGGKENLLVHGNHNIVYSVPDSVEIMSTYVLLEQGQWYDGEVGFVMEYLKPGMQVLDVGAGFGAYALGAAKKVGPTGKVFAFEPVDIMRKHLAISMVENGITNMEVSGRALGSTNGKMGLSESATPELTLLDSDGNDVQVVTLDNWWDFEGNPKLDVIKIDVNGQESNVLKGAERCITGTSPVLLIAASEAGPALGDVVDYLGSKGYTFFDFISGVGVLSPVEDWSRRDAYVQNVVAVKENQVSELKESGWVHDESIEVKDPEVGVWKKTLKSLPWTESLFAEWEKASMVPANKNYFRLLDYICAAEAMSISVNDDEESGDAQNSSITDRASISQNGKSTDSKPIKFREDRSKKAKLLLIAAQELISKYHAGDGGASAAYTLIRVLNTLGKRDQAVAIMQKLIEGTKLGQEQMETELPFLPPLSEQDNSEIKTEFRNWLTVRTVEAWITLKDLCIYLSGSKEKKMREMLEGNVELMLQKKDAGYSGISKNDLEKSHNTEDSIVQKPNLKKDSEIIVQFETEGIISAFNNDLKAALIAQLKGKKDISHQFYVKAIGNEKQHLLALYFYSLFKIESDKIEEAEESLRRIVGIDERFAPAYNALGVIERSKGKIEKSLEYFGTAYRLYPEVDEYRHNTIEAEAKYSRLFDADKNQSVEDVLVCLLNYKRPENIQLLVEKLKKQGLRPRIAIWNNSDRPIKGVEADIVIDAGNNYYCLPRWHVVALLAKDYVCIIDDDLYPSESNFLDKCIHTSRRFLDRKIIGYNGKNLAPKEPFYTEKGFHVHPHLGIDQRVDIIKGRFMFMHSALLNRLPIRCGYYKGRGDDIWISLHTSAYPRYHIVPGWIFGKLQELPTGAESLWKSADHYSLRNKIVNDILRFHYSHRNEGENHEMYNAAKNEKKADSQNRLHEIKEEILRIIGNYENCMVSDLEVTDDLNFKDGSNSHEAGMGLHCSYSVKGVEKSVFAKTIYPNCNSSELSRLYWKREIEFYCSTLSKDVIGVHVPELIGVGKIRDTYLLVIEYIQKKKSQISEKEILSFVVKISEFNEPIGKKEPLPKWFGESSLNIVNISLHNSVKAMSELASQKVLGLDFINETIGKVYELEARLPMTISYLKQNCKKVISHLDTHVGNIIEDEVTGRVVGLDWSLVGRGFLGEDVGRLIHPFRFVEATGILQSLDELFEKSVSAYINSWEKVHGETDKVPVIIAANLATITRFSLSLSYLKREKNRAEVDRHHFDQTCNHIFNFFKSRLSAVLKVIEEHCSEEALIKLRNSHGVYWEEHNRGFMDSFVQNKQSILSGQSPARYINICREIPGHRIVEIGAGECILALQMAQTKDYVYAIDINKRRIELAKEIKNSWEAIGKRVDNCEIILSDFFSQRDKFMKADTLVASRILYHLQSDIFKLFEFLPDNIKNVVLVGNKTKEKNYYLGNGGKYELGRWLYYATKSGMIQIVKKHGFEVINVCDVGDYLVVGKR